MRTAVHGAAGVGAPPPRAKPVLYGGVLAGNAAWRAEVVPKVATSDEARARERAELRLARRAARRARKVGDQASCWAELLKRVFGVDGWKCPGCEKRMTLRTIVVRAPASTPVVTGLLRAREPPGVETPGVGRVAYRETARGAAGGGVPRRAHERRAGERTSKIRRAETLRCGLERGYASRVHSARGRSWFLSSRRDRN